MQRQGYWSLLCPGVGRRIAGVVSWRPCPKRDRTAEGRGARRLKASCKDRPPFSTTMGMPLLQVPAALFARQASAFPALHLLSTASSEDHEEVGTLGVHKGGGGVGSVSAG